MVGFYDPAAGEGSAAIEAQGLAAIPSSTGAVLGAAYDEGFAANLTQRLLRSYDRETTGPEPLLDAETANSEYGIKGRLSFDKPVAQAVAKELFEHKREQLEREDTIARREGGLLTGGAARFTANMAAGIFDPINLAVGFVPLVGPTRYAGLLAGAGSAVGRAGIRAGVGAAEGALGMAALQPLEAMLSAQEREDYTMAHALRSIALGGLLGGGFHVGGGALMDRASGRIRNPVSQRIEDAGPEAREAMLHGSLAQTIEGRPVEVARALDAVDAARMGDDAALRSAASDMLGTARRDVDADPRLRAEADAAAARPSDTLQTIQRQIEDLERIDNPPRAVDTAPAGGRARENPEMTIADVATEIAEARAAAVERAAICITRGG